MFKEHIIASFNITDKEFDRLMDEIHNFYNETLEEYIQHRHFVLKREGLKNNEIYKSVLEEIKQRRFTASKLSERQVRRIIYG